MRTLRLAAFILALTLSGCWTSAGTAQDTDLGTAPPAMPDPAAAKIPLQVVADGSYHWKLDGVDQGQITVAMGVKRIMTESGRHEITARSVDGQARFDVIITVATGKQNSVKIAARAGGEMHTGTATTSPAPQPANPNNSVMNIGNPDRFVKITPQAYPHYAVSYNGGRKSATGAGWQITVIAIPFLLAGNYYDIKVQMVTTGVGSEGSTIELPDFMPATMPNTYTAIAKQLGKEAVICYTAHAASQPAQRWTGAFTVSTGAGGTALVPAREPTLEKASDAPCGGLRAVKETDVPVEAVGAPETKTSAANMEASSALARGAQLYNARQYAESRPLLITACNQGSTDACNSVGFMYQHNKGVATDYKSAKEYYLKSCNDDSSLSCVNLGTLYQGGQGVPQDPPQALKLFEKGCDAGVYEGCVVAAQMYIDHHGVPSNNSRALELVKKACDEELAGGCGEEAYIYAMGLGVPKDLAFAASLFTKACGMGSRNSCASIGMMYSNGDGVRRDPAKAHEYLRKACDMGDQESCDQAH